MNDEERDLIRYFDEQVLPAPPLRLSASEIIHDLPGFVASQIRHVRSGMSAGSAKDKLMRLKSRLEVLNHNKLP